jgi:hypothetical protein
VSAATTPDAVAGARRCALCAAPLGGPYCAQCGQADARTGRSLREVLLGQTGRLAHTVAMLLGRPGELAREIDEGRDRQSLRPLTLLLNLIALFFLVGGGPGGFQAAALIRNDTTGQLEAVATQAAARRGIDRSLFDERLENRYRSTYSLLIPLSAFVYAAALALVERRKRKSWLVHLSAAVHYLCASFLVSALLFGLAKLAGIDVLGPGVLPFVTLVYFAIYIVLMLRRTYGDSWPIAAAKTLFVMALGGASDTALAYVALGLSLITV